MRESRLPSRAAQIVKTRLTGGTIPYLQARTSGGEQQAAAHIPAL